MHVFYLHGFASSPASGKAAFFGERLGARGLSFSCPDLNLPDFGTLTISRMIAQVEAAIAALPPGPVALIGSSLGGFVAIHLAAREGGRSASHPIARLVLLAPAVDFGSPRDPHLAAATLARWRAEGWHDLFHYGYERPERVRIDLYDDASRYDAFGVRLAVPALVFQGTRDEVVSPSSVVRFVALNPTTRLRMVEAGHQLEGQTDVMWEETARFFGLQP